MLRYTFPWLNCTFPWLNCASDKWIWSIHKTFVDTFKYFKISNTMETRHDFHIHIGQKLTHWGRDKMAAVSQTTLSNYIRILYSNYIRISIKISMKFVPKGPINQIIQHWFRYWLGAGQTTSHYLNQWWLVYWHIYASLGLNELI